MRLHPQPDRNRRALHRGPLLGLAAVAVAFVLAQVALGPARIGFGWDETVYISQVTRHIPAAYMTAPRARGVSWLVAPVAWFTASTVAIRAYLTVLSALALVGSFAVWLRLLPNASVVLAAGLFAMLWPSLFYASEAMPNMWIALLGVLAAGAALRGLRGDGRYWYAASGLAIAGMALIRPSDAAWFGLPLLVAAVLTPRWRRTPLIPAVVGALVVGVAPWVIEAYTSYGGPVARLRASSRVEGGLRPSLGFLYQARALNGPLLCRPCTHAYHSYAFDAWWFALPVVVVATLVLSRRGRAFPVLAVTSAAAVSVALPYLFLVGYAAPRFLLPAYALASLPVAYGLTQTVRYTRTRWRHGRLAPAVLALGLALFAVEQAGTAAHASTVSGIERTNIAVIAEDLHQLGVRPPCLIKNAAAPPLAFYAGCSSRAPHGYAALIALNRQRHVAVLVESHERIPAAVGQWAHFRLAGLTHGAVWTAYLPPPR